jgi:tripartite-type tricarboxylate transporter receptor subunit TctC
MRLILPLCLSLLALVAAAQTAYPNKPVTLIVPFPPGGGTDVGARLLAKKLQEKWGQGVVIDNRGGAAGIVGMDAASKAKPDGYTLVVSNVGTIAINQFLYKKMPYEPDTAFAPVSLVAELPLALLVNPNLPFTSVKELIAYAKANPEKLTYASSGAGGAPHLAAEIFAQMAGVKLSHIPYKGGGPAVADLIAGHVNILFATVLEGAGHVKAGKLKALGVSSKTRSSTLPDVPTIAESGLPDYETGSWIGLLAPAATPNDILEKLSADVQEALANNEVKNNLNQQGAITRSNTRAQFQALIAADKKKYAEIINNRNIKLD